MTMRGISLSALAVMVVLHLPAQAQGPLFSDTFAGGQGGRPESWQIIGAPNANFWTIDKGRLLSGSSTDIGGDGYTFAVIGAPGADAWTDYSVATRFSMQSRNGRVALVGRWADARNHYRAYIQNYQGRRAAYIERVQNGKITPLAYGVHGVGINIPTIESGGGQHQIQLTMAGQGLALYLDGRRLLQASDDAFAKGPGGVGVWYASATFDDLSIEPAKAIAPAVSVPRTQAPPVKPAPAAEATQVAPMPLPVGPTQPSPAMTMPPASAESYTELKKRIEELRLETRQEISKIVEDLEKREVNKAGQISALMTKASKAADTNDFDSARKHLAEILAVDPGNSMVDLLRQQIDLREKAVAIEAMSKEAAAGIQEVAATAGQANMKVDTLGSALDATKKEFDNKFAMADTQISQVRQTAAGASETVTGFSDRYAKERQIYLYALIAVAAALIGLVLYVWFGIRKRNRMLLEQMRSLTLQPMMDLAGGGAATAALPDKKEKPARRVLGGSSTAPKAIEAPSMSQDVFAPAEDLSPLASMDLEVEEPVVPRRGNGPAKPAAAPKPAPVEEMSSSSLLFGGEEEEEVSEMDLSEQKSTFRIPTTSHEPEEDVSLRMTESSPEAGSEEEEEEAFSFFGPPKIEKAPKSNEYAGNGPSSPVEASFGPLEIHEQEEDERPEERTSEMDAREGKKMRASTLTTGEPEPEMAPLQLEEFSFDAIGGSSTTPPPPAEVEFMPLSFDDEEQAATQKLPTAAPSSRFTDLDAADTQQVPMMDSADTQEIEAMPRESMNFRADDETTQRIMPATEIRDDEEKTQRLFSAAPSGTTSLDLDLMGVELPAGEAQGKEISDTFFDQPFDDEVVGDVPAGWSGGEENYSFATLTVADETPAANSERYMQFKKNEGVGSAYYSCRFPDATGQVTIEFDVRCNKKNKFLLGFYIEKDGDFRQSIHTIVHQPDTGGASALRIQGEAVPYEMGTWRHIQYDVNLSTGRLSGYVDGDLVLDNIRLTNCPRSLNTLSIRDNIPTTGILLIDNIRINRG